MSCPGGTGVSDTCPAMAGPGTPLLGPGGTRPAGSPQPRSARQREATRVSEPCLVADQGPVKKPARSAWPAPPARPPHRRPNSWPLVLPRAAARGGGPTLGLAMAPTAFGMKASLRLAQDPEGLGPRTGCSWVCRAHSQLYLHRPLPRKNPDGQVSSTAPPPGPAAGVRPAPVGPGGHCTCDRAWQHQRGKEPWAGTATLSQGHPRGSPPPEQ